MEMKGCELNGGHPERCYVGSWEPVAEGSCVHLWKDHYANKKPNDTINGKPVLKCPQKWWTDSWDVDDENEDEISWARAFDFDAGDCIFDELKIEDQKWPILKWVAVKEHPNDADLLYMVPFFESDPYGNINDTDWNYYKKQGMNLPELEMATFAEDFLGQDHCVIFTGEGTWVHREDLIGLNLDSTREHLVNPTLKKLVEMVQPLRLDPPSQG